MENKKKRRRAKKIAIIILEISAIIILICYMREWRKYEEIFCKNTIINGEDCSLLNIQEAKRLIRSKQEQYVLEIEFKDNETEIITGKQIGFSIKNLEEELHRIKERQKEKIFLSGGIYSLEKYSYDQKRLRTVLLNKKQFKQEYINEKAEIEYVYNLDNKRFEIKKQNIYNLDFDEVFKEVSTAIEERKTRISLKNLYLIQENNNEDLNKLNSLISAEITYRLPGGEEYKLDADTLNSWLIQDKEGHYVKDETVWYQNIKEFVKKQLKPLAETIDKERQFRPTGKYDNVFVNSGNYGYQIDEEAEVEKLKKELETQKIVVREPCYKKVEVSSNENYGLGQSYVEIDLSRQKVWVYVDGNLEVETDCVTGCVNKGHETPTGIFTLTYKQKDRILRGKKLKNGKYEYESHVDYWMPFNGGIGLHDANWRNKFGKDIYINKGSHGCINLPADAARKLYYIINSEMPIIVYKSE